MAKTEAWTRKEGMKMKNGKKVPNCVPAKGVDKSTPKKKVSK